MEARSIIDKRLRTIKKAAEEIGVSASFMRKLVQDGILPKYVINTAVMVSMIDFESIARREIHVNKKSLQNL